jgi:hypothetical protein
MCSSGNVQARRRIIALKMNRPASAVTNALGALDKMLKLTLVALFVMSMATLTIAASALPVEEVPAIETANLG